jgi:hypothetical protein
MLEPINQTRCPICLEMIPENAFICGKCQSVLVPQEWKIWCAEFRSLDPHSRYLRWIEMTEAQKPALKPLDRQSDSGKLKCLKLLRVAGQAQP